MLKQRMSLHSCSLFQPSALPSAPWAGRSFPPSHTTEKLHSAANLQKSIFRCFLEKKKLKSVSGSPCLAIIYGHPTREARINMSVPRNAQPHIWEVRQLWGARCAPPHRHGLRNPLQPSQTSHADHQRLVCLRAGMRPVQICIFLTISNVFSIPTSTIDAS